MKLSDQAQDVARAYRLFFSSPDGFAVLMDLMKFCHFRTAVANDREEGMRQVFLHILEWSQLSDEQLVWLYAGRMKIHPTEPHNERDTSGPAAGPA